MITNDTGQWMQRLKILQGDITQQKVYAIVNAAGRSLLGGGGVDGAIHLAAGPELLAECAALGGCPTGEARITKGYRLPAKHVIHTVGPIWQADFGDWLKDVAWFLIGCGWHGGRTKEDELLANCYRSCFALLEEHGLRSIAFPAISCGAYGFPLKRAVVIALREIGAFLKRNAEVERVEVVCLSETVFNMYQAVLPVSPSLD